MVNLAYKAILDLNPPTFATAMDQSPADNDIIMEYEDE